MKFVQVSNTYLSENNDSENFDQLLKYCREEQVNMLFLTGNVFDGAPTGSFLQQIDEKFAALPDLRVFIVLGKSDGDAQKYAEHTFKSSTTVFAGSCIRRIYIARWNMEITGISYDGATWAKVKPESFHPGQKGALQILLLPFLGNDDETLDETYKDFQTEFDYVGLGLKTKWQLEKQRIYSSGAFESTDGVVESEKFFISGSLDAVSGNEIQWNRLGNHPKYVDQFIADVNAATEKKVPSKPDDIEEMSIMLNDPADHDDAAAMLRAAALARDTEDAPQDYAKEASADTDAARRFCSALEQIEDETLRKKAEGYGLRCLKETEEK